MHPETVTLIDLESKTLKWFWLERKRPAGSFLEHVIKLLIKVSNLQVSKSKFTGLQPISKVKRAFGIQPKFLYEKTHVDFFSFWVELNFEVVLDLLGFWDFEAWGWVGKNERGHFWHQLVVLLVLVSLPP